MTSAKPDHDGPSSYSGKQLGAAELKGNPNEVHPLVLQACIEMHPQGAGPFGDVMHYWNIDGPLANSLKQLAERAQEKDTPSHSGIHQVTDSMEMIKAGGQ